MSQSFPALPSALALAFAAASAGAAQAQSARPELHLDVATHAMPGMPGMGALGRVAGARTSYGMARYPGMPGRYLDVALHNPRQPGATAYQAVPKGLNLGDRIDLLAGEDAAPEQRNPAQTGTPAPAQSGSYRVLYYWGCGDAPGAGQPLKLTMSLRDGKAVHSDKAPVPRTTAAQDFDPRDRHVLWPNPSSRKSVSDTASLVGTHRVAEGGLTEPMQFELTGEHDFMPALSLRMDGVPADGPTLRWEGVSGARAYFVHATAMDGDTIVLWSSARDAYAGPELLDFLTDAEIARWNGTRTLLGADARQCRIPAGVFAAADKAAPMVQMVAHGGQRSIPTAGGTVHVRNKSSAALMPGLAAAGTEATKETTKGAVKDAAKGMLRGLLRR